MFILKSFRNLLGIFMLIAAFANDLAAAGIFSPNKNQTCCIDTSRTASVILIGENQQEYEMLQAKYPVSMLAVCKDDVNQSFKLWMDMLNAMQRFADRTQFEIKGARLWLNVFFAADGSIDCMAYYLKPSSRNIPEKEMKAFLRSFSKTYTLPLRYKSGFSHYGQVSFPILPENISN